MQRCPSRSRFLCRAPTAPALRRLFVCLAQILQVLACRALSCLCLTVSFAALPSSPSSNSFLLHLTLTHTHLSGHPSALHSRLPHLVSSTTYGTLKPPRLTRHPGLSLRAKSRPRHTNAPTSSSHPTHLAVVNHQTRRLAILYRSPLLANCILPFRPPSTQPCFPDLPPPIYTPLHLHSAS